MQKQKQQKGFTLIEILVSMSVFVLFLGVLINSYISIIGYQRDADENRILYMEARNVFEIIVQELREGMVDYPSLSSQQREGQIRLISKDLEHKTEFKLDEEGNILMGKAEVIDKMDFLNIKNLSVSQEQFVVLNDRIFVEELKFYWTPSVDPYDDDNVFKNLSQFHPKVTVYVEFRRDRSGSREPIKLFLQTTVSSRIYDQLYPNIIRD